MGKRGGKLLKEKTGHKTFLTQKPEISIHLFNKQEVHLSLLCGTGVLKSATGVKQGEKENTHRAESVPRQQ